MDWFNCRCGPKSLEYKVCAKENIYDDNIMTHKRYYPRAKGSHRYWVVLYIYICPLRMVSRDGGRTAEVRDLNPEIEDIAKPNLAHSNLLSSNLYIAPPHLTCH
jgi:hypothetical protein